MIEEAKQTAKKIGNRTSYALNAALIAFVAMTYLGVHSGQVHADVRFEGLSIGGGTHQLAGREQQLAAIANSDAAMHDIETAAKPAPQLRQHVEAPAPQPARKPVVTQ